MKFLVAVIMCVGILSSLGCQSTRTVSGYSGKNSGISTDISLGKVDKVKAYLARGGDPNAKNNYGWSLLQDTAIHNKPEITKLLLKAGANPNLTDTIGRPPIFWAKSPEVVEILLDAGTDISVKDITGKNVIQITQGNIELYKKQTGPIWAGMIKKQQQILEVLKGGGMPKELQFAKAGQLNKLKSVISGKASLQKTDMNGNTALHLAAVASHPEVVGYLLNNGASTEAKNNSGQTALDLVKGRKDRAAKLLSCKINKHCSSVAAFEKMMAASCDVKSGQKRCMSATRKDIHGVFVSATITEKMAGFAFFNSCEKFSYAACSQFIRLYENSEKRREAEQMIASYIPKAQRMFVTACGENGSVINCKKLVNAHAGLFEQGKVESALLFLGQKCRLKESGWIYKGSRCQGGLAHGKGEAVNLAKNLRFKGRFENGQRLKGKVYYDNQPMFDGALSEGKPNGAGICFYNNEPEKCEYYEGKRVDVLYKQRLALATQERKIDAKLAEMKKMQQQQNNRISQIQNRAPARNTQSTGSSVGQQIGDYAIKKAGEKVMDKLFDRLF